MEEVINVGMNRINKTPAAVKVTANGSLKGNKKSKHASESVARFGLSTLFQTNFFRLFFRYCTGV